MLWTLAAYAAVALLCAATGLFQIRDSRGLDHGFSLAVVAACALAWPLLLVWMLWFYAGEWRRHLRRRARA